MRRLCPVDPRRMQVAETPEKESQAETPSKETQLDKKPAALNLLSSRVPVIVVSSLVLAVIGAMAINSLPEYNIALPNIALPNFSRFAELFPRETASTPTSDPTVSATLKEIQSAQQQNVAALQDNAAILQQNTAMLQQGATTLESVRQGFTAQQTNLKTISNQLSSLIARVDSVQNAVTPLTTSSITQPNASARLARTSRKKTSRLPNKPVGPVSVGGAPLYPAPAPALASGEG